MIAEVFLYRPRTFVPQMEASGVFCEFNGRVLFLKRHSQKLEGLLWNIPGGKFEPGETALQAAARELEEEAGIAAAPESLQPIAPLYIRRRGVEFTFHLFYLPLHELPLLNVGPEEHIDSCWVNLQEGLQLPLISAGKEILEYFYLWKQGILAKKI